MNINKNELRNIINECINEIVNEEARMAASDLDSIIHHATGLKQLDAITDDANVEDWVKSKLPVAKENIIAVFNYYNHDSTAQDSKEEIAEDSKCNCRETCTCGKPTSTKPVR